MKNGTLNTNLKAGMRQQASGTSRLHILLHYLFGAGGLFFAARMAVSTNTVQMMQGGIATCFTVLFALTQPGTRFRKPGTGWRLAGKSFSEDNSFDTQH